MKKLGIHALLLVITMVSGVCAQEYPDKISGYKVHQTKVVVLSSDRTESSSTAADVIVKIGKPKLGVPGLLSVSVSVEGEFTSLTQAGKVDFLQFHDIRVNGVAVDVDDYKTAFEFKKGNPSALPTPVRGSIGLTGIAKAAYKQLTESKDVWDVTGTVFVFGRFKRYGIEFKRVIPIRLDLQMSDPLR